eukprot:541510_1
MPDDSAMDVLPEHMQEIIEPSTPIKKKKIHQRKKYNSGTLQKKNRHMLNAKRAIDKIKTFDNFFRFFRLTKEYKQKFMQHGFTHMASFEYIDEYVLYKKIGMKNKQTAQGILNYCSQINKTHIEQKDEELISIDELENEQHENIIDLSSLTIKEQSRLGRMGKLKLNEEVTVMYKVKGIIRCFDEKKSQFGIQLIPSIPEGEHNGTVDGVTYFECKNKMGVFLDSEDIISSKKDFKILLTATIKFSKSVSENKIKSYFFRNVIKKYMSYHAKKLNVESINILAISGDDSDDQSCYVNFECKFKNLDNVRDEKNDNANSDELMRDSVANLLQNNDKFLNGIISALNTNKDQQQIKIDKLLIRGINDISIDQVIEERQKAAKREQSKYEELALKPLNKFTSLDIITIIKGWILNDNDYIKMSEQIFNIVARSNLFGGIEVDKMREYIRMLLDNKISKFITTETFDIIYHRIQTLIAERSANIYHQPSLHIAKLICNYPLNVLCEYVKTENIDGEYLFKNGC